MLTGRDATQQDRAALLGEFAARARTLREPVPGLETPSYGPLAVGELPDAFVEESTALASGRHGFWSRMRPTLETTDDVRTMLGALVADGFTDPARRLASILTRASDGSYGPTIADTLGPADAKRWWPLFAERLDLVDEYLAGPTPPATQPTTTVPTTPMTAAMLRILAHFPVVPDALLPRLTALALDHTRHRRAARELLAGHPQAHSAAERGLQDASAAIRASAAEWLVEQCGRPDGAPRAATVTALEAALAVEHTAVVREVLGRAVGTLRGETVEARRDPADGHETDVRNDGVLSAPVDPGWFPLELVPAAAWESGAPVPPQVLRWWAPRALDELDRFRETALARGIPLPDVENWMGLARQCVLLNTSGRGPAVGHLGRPVMLPPQVRLHWESDDDWTPDPLVATIDLARLPSGATNLPLPADGTLMLFCAPDLGQSSGSALYIAAGSPVQERHLEYDDDAYVPAEEFHEVMTGDLYAEYIASLPDHDVGDANSTVDMSQRPRARELLVAWEKVLSGDPLGSYRRIPDLQLGGHPHENEGYGDPVGYLAADEVDADRWILLATWKPGLDGMESSTIYWAMPSDDLAAGRIDRIGVEEHCNP